MSEPIRLFVGTSANGEDFEAEAVLEYSARKYCSQPLEITWMRQAASGPWSGWACGSGRTPFTHFRWSIPGACGFQGKAIYTDVDFLFRADLAELWNQHVPGVALVRNPTGKLSTSCILFDCAHAKGHVPDVPSLRKMSDAHGTLLNYFRANQHLLSACVGNWDCADFEKDAKGKGNLHDDRIKAIHYTRIECQLHLKHAAKRLAAEGRAHWYTGAVVPHVRPDLQALFDDILTEALAAGYTPAKYDYSGYQLQRKDFKYKTHVGVPA